MCCCMKHNLHGGGGVGGGSSWQIGEDVHGDISFMQCPHMGFSSSVSKSTLSGTLTANIWCCQSHLTSCRWGGGVGRSPQSDTGKGLRSEEMETREAGRSDGGLNYSSDIVECWAKHNKVESPANICQSTLLMRRTFFVSRAVWPNPIWKQYQSCTFGEGAWDHLLQFCKVYSEYVWAFFLSLFNLFPHAYLFHFSPSAGDAEHEERCNSGCGIILRGKMRAYLDVHDNWGDIFWRSHAACVSALCTLYPLRLEPASDPVITRSICLADVSSLCKSCITSFPNIIIIPQ